MAAEAPSVPVFPSELRAGLARREPVALARFFDAYFDRVYAYLRRLVSDEHLAEDLTQEVFLQVHRALASYDPDRDPRPWLFTIATNKLRDHWRSRAAQTGAAEVSLDQDELGERPAWLAAEPAAADGAPTGEGHDEGELGARVRAAINALPEGLRATVQLRVYEDLSFEDIARILGRNEVAARKRYSRALAALRERLGELWSERAEGPR